MTVEVCFECDIADCHHIRARRAAPPDVAQTTKMRQALELCPPDNPQMSGDEFRAAIKAWWKLYARPALEPIAPPDVAQAARVLSDVLANDGQQNQIASGVKWSEAWLAMSAEYRDVEWTDWPVIFDAALRVIAEETP